MCTIVLIYDRGGDLVTDCMTYGELFEALGVPPLLSDFDPIGVGPAEHCWCLCSVDLDATAKAAGYSCHYDWGDAVFTPMTDAKKDTSHD